MAENKLSLKRHARVAALCACAGLGAVVLAGCASPPTATPAATPPASSPPPVRGGGPKGRAVAQGTPVAPAKFTQNDVMKAANDFFGGTTQGLAQAVQRIFSQLGEPNAYITGNEGGGAFVVGLRYGTGELHYRGGKPMRLYWAGPSAGFQFGGNASKVFMLVYDLHNTNQLFQRFPGVDGSIYVVAGLGVNYNRADGVTVAPIRTGVGLQAGVDVGYLKFTPTRDVNPL